MRIAAFGDIHGNVDALTAALRLVDKRGADQLVILGDLLTYGVDVNQTLDLVMNRTEKSEVVLIRGNHDAMFEDLLETGASSYAQGLPSWIRESVMWSLDKLDSTLWKPLRFVNDWSAEGIYCSHANPWGARDWRYLSDANLCIKAADTLRSNGNVLGVFGHTHRRAWVISSICGQGATHVAEDGSVDPDTVHIINPGALGQCRDRFDRIPRILWVEWGPQGVRKARFERAEYQFSGLLDRTRRSGLSPSTVQKLLSYFGEA